MIPVSKKAKTEQRKNERQRSISSISSNDGDDARDGDDITNKPKPLSQESGPLRSASPMPAGGHIPRPPNSAGPPTVARCVRIVPPVQRRLAPFRSAMVTLAPRFPRSPLPMQRVGGPRWVLRQHKGVGGQRDDRRRDDDDAEHLEQARRGDLALPPHSRATPRSLALVGARARCGVVPVVTWCARALRLRASPRRSTPPPRRARVVSWPLPPLPRSARVRSLARCAGAPLADRVHETDRGGAAAAARDRAAVRADARLDRGIPQAARRRFPATREGPREVGD